MMPNSKEEAALCDLVGGKDKYDKLPTYDFTRSWTDYKTYHPSQTSISMNEVKAPITRGINGKPGFEYLIVNYQVTGQFQQIVVPNEVTILYYDQGILQESSINLDNSLSHMLAKVTTLLSESKLEANDLKKLFANGFLDERLGCAIQLLGF
jgi:hypothetical protein